MCLQISKCKKVRRGQGMLLRLGIYFNTFRQIIQHLGSHFWKRFWDYKKNLHLRHI